ncbi:autotransporter assembly complex protein TamB [Vibrio sp. SCSIO 43137]|uniref:autotransporter assembly complex protein TamB n=1 Tax=Vibrio sp. SCSIO 43137 TaxID=3021011 RepID=UPI0023078A45|nr:translocation/assembly module TamB domain-containing protein [Vibrio sp. SCSIO 43137]WCE29425.1 translocation/assembly module TamB [Vibrio sp. SCSIO 43137]
MKKRLLKWSKRAALTLVSLVLTIVLLISFALFTNSGLKTLIWAAEKAIPQLQIADAEGALFPEFTLKNSLFSDDTLGIDTKVKQLTLAVNFECLFAPSVCVDKLEVSGVVLDVAPGSKPETTEQEPATSGQNTISSPLPVTVQQLALNDIQLNLLGHKVSWQSFSSAIRFSGSELAIKPTFLNKLNLQLAETKNSSDEAAASAETPASDIALPKVYIPLAVDVEAFELNHFMLQGTNPINVEQLQLSVLLNEYLAEVRKLNVKAPQGDIALKGQATLKDSYPLNLEVEANLKLQPVDGQRVLLSASGDLADLQLSSVLSGLIEAEIESKIKPVKANFPFDITISKGKLQWPLKGDADYHVDISEFKTDGQLNGYNLSAAAAVSGKAIPATEFTLAGKGDLKQIELSRIDLATLGGTISGEVMANWQPPLNWQSRLELDNIQPGLQWPEAEGSVSGVFENSGELLASGGWKVSVPALDINGLIRGYPLQLQGALQAEDKSGKGELSVVTQGVSLKHGPNEVRLSGSLDKEWRLDTEIDFPQLGKTVPDAQGNIQGKLKVTGLLAEPQLESKLTASKLAYSNLLKIESVGLIANVNPLPDINGSVELSASDIRYQDNTFDSVSLNFSGTQQQHQLSFAAVSELINAALDIKGGLPQQPDLLWNGELTKAQFSTKQGLWKLDKPASVAYDFAQQQVKLQSHCWIQDSSEACLTKDLLAGKSGEAHIAVKHFNFNQIAMFLPEDTDLTGEMNLDAAARWSEESKPQADISLRLPKGEASRIMGKPVIVGWDSTSLNAKLKDNRLMADWLIDLTNNGEVNGRFDIGSVTAEPQILDGLLQLKQIHLDMLKPVAGEYGDIGALIDSSLTISGPVVHPKIMGNLLIDKIIALGDISPLDVEKGRIDIQFSGYQAVLDADINTSDGILKVDGDAGWEELSDWHTNLNIDSDELQVKVPSMVRVRVEPDLQLSVTPQLAKVSGKINLPWGKVEVEELPASAVTVSSDQVILNNNLKPEEKGRKMPMAFESDVVINIGDEFAISAFGLTGKLNGQLNVTQKDKGPYVVGEVVIKQGQYRSFGQDLIISEGKILMNGPVDRPYLAIKAIRNPANTQDNVVAGVQVSGPANEPVTTIFSQPAMPQANALSYLLRGQNIDGKSDGNAMTTALIGLSLAKSGKLVGKIGEAFGVSDLHLDTAGSGDSSQVTVSGYITPELQVKYGVGIFNSLGEFTVRYQLMTDLYLEAVSGVSSAVDLLYQFEFD